MVSYQAACTAVMIEGAIFFVLALTGLRYRIIRLIPEVSMLCVVINTHISLSVPSYYFLLQFCQFSL